jgi:hypothetical protein
LDKYCWGRTLSWWAVRRLEWQIRLVYMTSVGLKPGRQGRAHRLFASSQKHVIAARVLAIDIDRNHTQNKHLQS